MKEALLGLCLLFLILYVAPIGVRPLTLPDETRYAEVPREMLVSGDWVVPRLCGVRYFEKPPMGYWLTATSMAVFGENRFAVRLPSAIATGLSAALLVLLVTTATGTVAPALWTAFIFLTIPFVFGLGVVNVLDAPFAMCVTGSIVCAFLAVRVTASPGKYAWLAAVGVFAGCGFLIKGFLAFVLPAIVIGPFLLIERRWRELLAIPWIPMTVAAIVVLPWAVAIHFREPDYWRYFVMVEHLQRFTNPGRSQHPEPFWFLAPYIVAGPLLWSFLAPALLRKLPQFWGEHKSLTILSCCWLAIPFLFFSVSSGKLPTYILPCFAPFAVLLGIGAWRLAATPPDRMYRVGCSLSAITAGVGLACLAVIPLLPESARIYGPGETLKVVTALVALSMWLLLSILAAFAKDSGRGMLFAGIALIPAMLSMHFALPERALQGKAPERVLVESSPLITPKTKFFTNGYIAPAINWQYKTANIVLSGAGELTYGLSFDDQKHRLVTEEDIARRLANPQRSRDFAIVFFDAHIKRLLPSLPQPDETRSAHGITLLFYRAHGARKSP